MKSKSTVLAIVGFLVGSAVGLGVMHMIRTDRRAKAVADSLNRSVTPNRSLKQEGPFAVSKSEPGPTDAIKQATTPTVRGPMSLDLEALKPPYLRAMPPVFTCSGGKWNRGTKLSSTRSSTRFPPRRTKRQGGGSNRLSCRC